MFTLVNFGLGFRIFMRLHQTFGQALIPYSRSFFTVCIITFKPRYFYSYTMQVSPPYLSLTVSSYSGHSKPKKFLIPSYCLYFLDFYSVRGFIRSTVSSAKLRRETVGFLWCADNRRVSGWSFEVRILNITR